MLQFRRRERCSKRVISLGFLLTVPKCSKTFHMKTATPLSPALQRALELREEGQSHRRIAEILEAEGVPLPPGRGKKWNHTAGGRLFRQFEAVPTQPAPSTAVDPPPAASPAAPAPQPPPPASLSVKIQGPWSATDSLLWEFLLHKVWADLLKKSEHTIRLKEAVMGLRLPPRRQDQEHLWEALDRLAAARVIWHGQLDEARPIVAPLISAWSLDASLSFAVPPALVKLLEKPAQYVRLKELRAAKSSSPSPFFRLGSTPPAQGRIFPAPPPSYKLVLSGQGRPPEGGWWRAGQMVGSWSVCLVAGWLGVALDTKPGAAGAW